MKTLTPLPDRIVAWFAVLALMFSSVGAIAQTDSLVAGQPSTSAALTKLQAKAEYVRTHIVSTSDSINVFVTRVVDGDTFFCVPCLDCTNEISIRVLELDTFEKARIPRLYKQMADWNLSEEEALLIGKGTTIEAKRILEGKQVTLHRGNKHDMNIDKYYRPLRYVIVDGKDYSQLMRDKGLNARRK